MSGAVHEFAILFGVALISVILFRRIGLGAVLGYLVAGALVGPHGLGLVGGGEQKLALAELGIAMLLFLVGLELDPSRLWRLRREIFGVGLAQVVLCAMALLGFLLAVTGFSPAAAIALALPLALSSTAQVLPSLKSAGRINTPFGERAFSILLFQDLSIVPLITIIAALSRAPADPSAPPGWMMAVYAVLAVAGLMLVGRFFLRPLLRVIGGIGERELFVVVGLVTVLASAALMHWLHLSTALGAFVAGVMLADSPYRHELEADVEPFRTILLGLFFLAVGMVLDLQVVLNNPLLVIGLALGVVAVKTAVIWGIARFSGMGWRSALGLALLLSQGGEFGFVLFNQAMDARLILPEAASLFSAVVTFSMATTPFLMIFARWLEERGAGEGGDSGLPGPEEAPPASAIVVGYGRFGQVVAQHIQGADCRVTLIDHKPAQIELSGRYETKVYYGDGLRLDVLRLAGADEAKLIALCIDGRALEAAHVRAIADAFPQAQILVRVFDRLHLIAMDDTPAQGAVREVFESAMTMGVMALEALEIEPDDIHDIARAVRHLDKARLSAQIKSGSMEAGNQWRFGRANGPRPKELLETIAERLRAKEAEKEGEAKA